MDASTTAPHGRESDVRRAVATLEADPASPRMVLLRGEAGIGKSTVFDAVVRLTHPAMVLRAAEAERTLPYAALADLLGDQVASARPAMPPGHADALAAALGTGDPVPTGPDPRAVARATTEVLTAMLAVGPVSLALDDVQWLDHETETCLAFAVRRLVGRGLGVLLSMRTGSASGIPLGLAGHAELVVVDLDPLPVGDLGAAIADHLGRALPRPTLVRVHEMSRGNPLLALELARHLPDDAAPDELPTAPDVERLIGRRVRDLRRNTIDLLILAAACGRPTVDLLAAATGSSALDCASRLGPEASDGLVDVDSGVVRFVHPLFVSAVLNAVSPGARVDAHRRLAELTTGAERAQHLAAAASGPDELVAAIIEAEADGLARRGAPASAAALMERAAALSPDQISMGRRRLLAASLYALAGDGGRARRLSSLAVAELPPGPTRARGRAHVFTAATTAEERDVALDDAGEDDGACALIHWTYARAAFLQLDLPASITSAQTAVMHAERAGDTPTMVAAMVHLGFALNLQSPGAGLEVLHAAAALPFTPASPYDSAAAKIALNQTAMDDLDVARTTLEDLAQSCRAMGADGGLAGLSLHLVELEARAGDLHAARAWIKAGLEVSAGDGEWQSPHITDYLEALVLGRKGDGEGAVAAASRGAARAEAAEDWAFDALLAHAAAVGHLQCGRPEEALGLLTAVRESCRTFGLEEPGVIRFHGPEIEALIGVGDLETARTRIDELDALGRQLARPRLVGEAAFGRGLVLEADQDHEAAIVALGEALDIFDGASLPWERERARLELGIARRRARQRRDARDTLDAAEAAFVTMGADGWAARAAQERERISGRAASTGELTPIETQVADLVASGLPNKQVAAQLFLSPKTVESHLSHIYAKTGVRSRTELAALRMGGPASPTQQRAATDSA